MQLLACFLSRAASFNHAVIGGDLFQVVLGLIPISFRVCQLLC